MVATKLNDGMMSRGLGRVKYARIGMMPARNVVVLQIARYLNSEIADLETECRPVLLVTKLRP